MLMMLWTAWMGKQLMVGRFVLPWHNMVDQPINMIPDVIGEEVVGVAGEEVQIMAAMETEIVIVEIEDDLHGDHHVEEEVDLDPDLDPDPDLIL